MGWGIYFLFIGETTSTTTTTKSDLFALDWSSLGHVLVIETTIVIKGWKLGIHCTLRGLKIVGWSEFFPENVVGVNHSVVLGIVSRHFDFCE